MDSLLQQGVTAVKAGDRERAYGLLTRAVQDPAMAEQAWLWMSAVVGQDAERLYCLENALHANPGNERARQAADLLRQKGVFPAVPTGPAPAAPLPQAAPAPAASGNISPTPLAAAHPAAAQAQDMNGLVKYTAQELARKTPRVLIQKNLVAQGLSAAAAASIVQQTEAAFKNARRARGKKRMLRGMWWTLGGLAVTILTALFAAQLGGFSIVWYGAILVGLFELVTGFFTWLGNH